jgi:hypothetical protein
MATAGDNRTGGAPDSLWVVVESLGRSTAILLFDSAWMIRRTDAVELISDTWVRHETTVDVAIPLDLEPITRPFDPAGARFAVPVMLLPKVRPTLMRFDLRSGADEVSLPTRDQNALASYAALLWAATSVLETWPLPGNLREELMFVAIGAPEYAAPVSWYLRAPRRGLPVLPDREELPTLALAEDALIAWHGQLAGVHAGRSNSDADDGEREDPHLAAAGEQLEAAELLRSHNALAKDLLASWLLRKLATSSPLLVHVRRAPTGRQTIRLGYDENVFKSQLDGVGKSLVARSGWLAYPYVIYTPYVGAASYHFEFIAPHGVEAIHSELLEQSPEEADWDRDPQETRNVPEALVDHDDDDESARPKYDYVPIRGERVHLYRIEDPIADALLAKVYLRASRAGFISGAALAATAIALILLACAVLTRPLVSHGTGSQALLLLLPGLLATVVARAGGHGLVIRMLQGARRTLLLSGVFAFIGAGMLTLINTGKGAHATPWQRWVFILLAIAALWGALKLLLARVLPRRPEPQGFLERRVERARVRAERRSRRRACRRQRALRLRVTALQLDWNQARQLSDRVVDSTRLRLEPGPQRVWWRTEDPAVRIVAHEDARPMLSSVARPSDPYVIQELGTARRLAETVRWLGQELPGGYKLEIRWAPLSVEIRRGIKYVRHNLPEILSGGDPAHWKLLERHPRPVAEVAAAARRGGLRMNRVHVIAGDTESRVGRASPESDELP